MPPTHPPLRVIDLCGQDGCTEDASHRMYWPGSGASFVCEDHQKRAAAIAEHMGFELVFEPIVMTERRRRT
jgi:hypothetical protein